MPSRSIWPGCGAMSCSAIGNYVCATAGTTGRRGAFVWDFSEWVTVVSSYNRAFDWAGSTAG
jgi:phenylacetate-coenzyme A ligase PaaK-like adenylate-forming protein